MFRNYLKTAYRSIKNNRAFAFINILGLSLGITCCLTQYAIIKHEYSFDDYHKQSSNIYRVVEHYAGDNEMQHSAFLPNPLGHTLEESLSGVDVIPIVGPLNGNIKIREGNKVRVFSESKILFSNATFLASFDFPIIQGDGPEALQQKNKVFLTKRIAEKYFGTSNAIGRTLSYSDDMTLEVAGVLADIPYHTNVYFDMIVSYPTIRNLYPGWLSNWGATWETTAYLVKKPETSGSDIEKQMKRITKAHMGQDKWDKSSFHLQPLSDVHTNSTYADAPGYVPPKEALWGSVFTVILILIVSILNFVNLSTSQVIKRSKEVGIRKTLGGNRANISIQFLLETFFIVFFACLLGLTLGQVLMNLLNEVVSPFPFRVEYDMTVVIFAIGLILVITFLAGLYPSLILTRFSPVASIRNQMNLTGAQSWFSLRKTLTVMQFTVANLLIAITIIAASQMNYIKSKDLGFDDNNVLLMHFTDNTSEPIDVIKTELANLNFVESITRCQGPPQTGVSWNASYNLLGQPSDESLKTNMRFVDANYINTYKIALLAGRNYEDIQYPDSTQKLVVNEEFIARLGLRPEDAINRTIAYNGNLKGTIIGVIKNFHLDKLSRAIRPTMLSYRPGEMNDLNLKLSSDKLPEYLPALKAVFDKYDQEGFFEPVFLKDRILDSYMYENTIHTTFYVFAFLAIAIDIMGLYGLVSFMIEKNKKPISIRKIFGASTQWILIWMSKMYIILIFISFLIALPISYWMAQQWLNNFHYNIEISVSHYVINLLIILSTSAVTVGYKSFKAANANPVDSLRYE